MTDPQLSLLIQPRDGQNKTKQNKTKRRILVNPTNRGYFILPLLFRSLFTGVFTVGIFFHPKKNFCYDTISFPVEHALSLPPNFWRFVVEHDLNTWTDHAIETRDHVNIDEYELDVFFRFFVRNVF